MALQYWLRRRRSPGFSLAEILICIAVVSVGFLGTAASLTAAHRAGGYGQRMTEATNYCRQVCEIIRARGLAYRSGDLPATGTDLQTPPDTTVALNQGSDFAALPGDTRYRRAVTTERLAPAGFGRQLFRVTVTVQWPEANDRTASVRMITLSRVPLT